MLKSNHFTKATRLLSECKIKRKKRWNKTLCAWGKPDISSYFSHLSLVNSLGHRCRTLCYDFLSRLWLRISLLACRGTHNWMLLSPFLSTPLSMKWLEIQDPTDLQIRVHYYSSSSEEVKYKHYAEVSSSTKCERSPPVSQFSHWWPHLSSSHAHLLELLVFMQAWGPLSCSRSFPASFSPTVSSFKFYFMMIVVCY